MVHTCWGPRGARWPLRCPARPVTWAAALAAAREDIKRLLGDGGRAGGGAAPAGARAYLGLTTGPVPPRVDAYVKAGLLDLVEHAVEDSHHARRCRRPRSDCIAANTERSRAVCAIETTAPKFLDRDPDCGPA